MITETALLKMVGPWGAAAAAYTIARASPGPSAATTPAPALVASSQRSGCRVDRRHPTGSRPQRLLHAPNQTTLQLSMDATVRIAAEARLESVWRHLKAVDARSMKAAQRVQYVSSLAQQAPRRRSRSPGFLGPAVTAAAAAAWEELQSEERAAAIEQRSRKRSGGFCSLDLHMDEMEALMIVSPAKPSASATLSPAKPSPSAMWPSRDGNVMPRMPLPKRQRRGCSAESLASAASSLETLSLAPTWRGVSRRAGGTLCRANRPPCVLVPGDNAFELRSPS